MELIRPKSVLPQSDYYFFCFTIIDWLALSFLIERMSSPLNAYALMLFAFLAALPFVLFKMFDSIDTISTLTSHREVLGMTLSFLAGTITCDLLLQSYLLTNAESELMFLNFKNVVLALIACLSFILLYVLLMRCGRRKKIVFDCPSEMSTKICKVLENLNLAPSFEYLTRESLNGYMEQDKLGEVDLIVICREATKSFKSDAILLNAHLAGVLILDAHEMASKLTGHISLNETDLSEFLLAATHKTYLRRILLLAKHLIEPLAALVLGIILMPILLVTAAIIKVTSPGPVLYSQIRTGFLGRTFKLIKFRSMRNDAETNGPQWSSPNDARVTRFGALMRRTRIDELPQLWNIVCGQMSFIGPRPERPEIYKKLEQEVPLFTLRTLVRPGITGWAQVNSGYAASSAESLLKLEYDLSYIQHMSLCFDFYILLKTIKVAFAGDKIPTTLVDIQPIMEG